MVTTTAVGYRLLAVLVSLGLTGCKPTCETLDTLSVGAQIGVGAPPTNSFQPPTMDIAAHPFQWANGTSTSTGHAKIENAGLAGGSGNDMRVNNLLTSISVGFGQTLKSVEFAFGEHGGNLNVSVNNQLKNFANFADIHGQTIAGVKINVLSGGAGNDKGKIEFTGTMNDQASGLGQFAVGGQELWIDDICFTK
jgi:hypothetical protein